MAPTMSPGKQKITGQMWTKMHLMKTYNDCMEVAATRDLGRLDVVGTHFTLLAHAWLNGGSLSGSPAFLAQRFGLPFEIVVPVLQSLWIGRADGKSWAHEELTEAHTEAVAHIEQRQSAGKRSAAKRAGRSTSVRATVATTVRTHNTTQDNQTRTSQNKNPLPSHSETLWSGDGGVGEEPVCVEPGAWPPRRARGRAARRERIHGRGH